MATSEIKKREYGVIKAFPSGQNIDNLESGIIGIANASTTGTKPTGLGGNQYIIMSYTVGTAPNFYLGMQMAIGYGSNKIAVRNKDYSASGTTGWSAWRII